MAHGKLSSALFYTKHLKITFTMEGNSMNRWKILILLWAALLIACSQQVKSIKATDPVQLATNNGYLLLSVDSVINLEQLNVSGTKSFHLGADDLTKGKHYILVDLPAGDYQITSIKFNHWLRLQLQDGLWNFNVRPGQISYIGELQLKGWALELENRSSMALQYLEQNHTELLKQFSVRYSGPGDDHYFEFVEASGGAK
jgi:hypothetical protein